MGSERPSVIKKHAMKVLERFVRKNPTATTCNIKEQVPEVAAISVKHTSRPVKEKTEDTIKDSSPEASPNTQNKKEEAGLCQTVLPFYR